MKRASSSIVAGLFFACGPAPEPAKLPPVTSALVPPSDARSPGKGYAGHGAESVSAETLARFAPAPLPADVSRRIQAMLDIRAPLGARLSPDGKSLYFAWNVSGTYQVWKSDGPRRFPSQLTGGEDVTRVVATMPDGKHVVVSRDRKGEENPGLYVMAEAGGPLRLVQHEPKVQTQLEYVSDDGKWVYFRANDVKPDSYAIYRWEVATGKREAVFGEPGL